MYRNIEIILYDYDRVIEITNICIKNNFDYAFILHDKDIKDDGTLKKAHYHFRIFYKDKKSVSAWSKIFGVKENEIEILKDKKRAIRYLIHYDSDSKYHYDFDDIITNFNINEYFKDRNDENFDIKLITDYISTKRGIIRFSDLKDFVLDNQLWASYRRSYSIIRDLVFEHNNSLDY